ncbi:MAG TPA: hypothetical protein VM582_03570 [Candidatus Thermoplasmatota archaeon]|nr:hypothetical protein [Candidatus Thermoplasmatota archaeon]
MAARAAPVPLENDPRNPCVGCGPEHPAGLRLSFQREGDAVTTALAATERVIGWPGRLHSGILYLAMLETANWTLYGLRGRVGIPTRTSALEAKRWVATGETLTLAGRLTASDARAARARVEARDASGALVASLERDFDLPDRATFLARMGYDAVPPGLEDALPEEPHIS